MSRYARVGVKVGAKVGVWAFGVAALAGGASALGADTIMAKYDVFLDPGFNVQCFIRDPVNPPLPNPHFISTGAAQIDGRRQDLPAGPGVNADIARDFVAFCVEIDGDISVSVGGTFSANTLTHRVFNLLGSTTNTGGVPGPTTFGGSRTNRLQRLWGQFYDPSMKTNLTTATAFQLAVWEIEYENEGGALDVYDSSSRFFLNTFPTASGDLANAWLSQVDLPGPSQALYLLSSETDQDLITPVPGPGAAVLGIAGAGLAARRRRGERGGAELRAGAAAGELCPGSCVCVSGWDRA